MEYELRCIHNNRKSFYNKAVVIIENNKTILRSYHTDVAYIENGQAIVKGAFSNTTTRHIKEFLLQNGFKADNWKQINRDYSQTKEAIEKENEIEDKKANSMLKSIAMVSAIGEIFCKEKKDKNDWKLRMLKVGLENKGLSVPDDWETLTEDEKERRLNGVIAIAKGN